MPNKNDKIILRFVCLLLFTCTLTGCILTRVSDSAHAKEVDSLNVVGLSLDAARKRATEKGFECSEYSNLNTVVTDDGEHRWLQTECSKKSAEMFCPQMRFVVLNIDPKTNNVIEVGKYIDQRTCF
ncbi:TPA: hypothetical protein JD824_RS02320 [Citrobacter freundii]|uniref:hypothetical protein n=1 Tax=Citrobacter freundii TaxID=546 RepID=UPI001A235B47|nr:hypothetical protein [Citrobacter freundii]MCY3449230.1 hypothetical protein [Citrobacter freundii]HBV2906294.1 hypothetical protein [Citrobacter freundii]HCD1226964.1 hypothetical protein [Citrobacter freundii]HDT6516507.1 hypothetical protein [Citrobacter freundii]HEE9966905.1 hypothetical protein [Citrobacter freundii]